VIARHTACSAEARRRLAHRPNLPYGEHADERLDVFPAGRAGAPVQVFVHGGAWKNFTKDDFSFAAESFVPMGVHTVVLNFSKLPGAKLSDVARQVRRALEWVVRNAASFGGDPQRVYVCAHSSGAHLSAMALSGHGASPGVARDFIKGATLISGPYYMEPVVLSARGSYVHLSGDEVRELSPGLFPERLACPVLIAYAEHDTDEFQRQSREFAAGLERAGRLEKLIRFPALNHFELPEKLRDASHGLTRAVLAQMGLTSFSDSNFHPEATWQQG
jgi:arylformamidase